MDAAQLSRLLRSLIALPKELEWVEFKLNKAIPQEIGEDISALSNAAALLGRTHGFLVWGVDDKTHEIKGTTFKFSQAKQGAEG
jgi:predicted HTH transcriptional regulator